jgi:8-oxo-dGTP diphosphatase
MTKPIFCSIGILIKEIDHKNLKLWVQPREEKGALKGKLEFPGGKIEVNESPKDALFREFKEEINLDLSILSNYKEKIHLFKTHPYRYANRHVVLYVHFILLESKDSKILNLLSKQNGEWRVLDYQSKSSHFKGIVPEANMNIIDELAWYFENNTTEGDSFYKVFNGDT